MQLKTAGQVHKVWAHFTASVGRAETKQAKREETTQKGGSERLVEDPAETFLSGKKNNNPTTAPFIYFVKV